MKAKTIPVSADIHKMLKYISLTYGVTLQEAAAQVILRGIQDLNVKLPDWEATPTDPFWELAKLAANDMHRNKTDNIETIQETIREVRAQRAKDPKK